MTRALRHWPALGLAAVVGIAALWIGHYSGRASDYVVMTDELQYVKLALGIWDNASLAPTIHGAPYGSYSQLYPLILAPLWGLLSVPDAFRTAHDLNALIFASAAIPAYLLVRGAAGPPVVALVTSALSVAIPWSVFAGVLMTEVVAYPAFLWGVLGIHRAVADPSARRELLAIAGIGLAFFARSQFIFLAPIFVLAALLHDVGFAPSTAVPGRRLAAIGGTLRTLPTRRPVLTGAAVLGVLYASVGGVKRLSGPYSAVADGDILPTGVWRLAISHFDYVAVAAGGLPAVLALAWVLHSLVLPRKRAGHALAVVLLLCTGATALVAASFDLRFGGATTQDRYAFYLAPLLLVGTAVLLTERRRPGVTLIAAIAAFWAMIKVVPFAPEEAVFYRSTASTFFRVITGQTTQLHGLPFLQDIGPSTAVALVMAVAAVAVGIGLRFVRWEIVATATAVVVGVAIFAQTTYIYDKLYLGGGHVGATIPTGSDLRKRDWVDQALPDDAVAGILPRPEQGGGENDNYWSLEFWNKTVDQQYAYRGVGGYTPFPYGRFDADLETGRITMEQPGPQPVYLVQPRLDFTLHLRGERLGTNGVFNLIGVGERPWVDLIADGMENNDGLIGGEMSMTIFGPGAQDGLGRRLHISLTSPHADPSLGTARRWAIRVNGRTFRGVAKAGTNSSATVPVCVPPGRPSVDLRMETTGLAGESPPGLLLYDAWTTPDPTAC